MQECAGRFLCVRSKGESHLLCPHATGWNSVIQFRLIAKESRKCVLALRLYRRNDEYRAVFATACVRYEQLALSGEEHFVVRKTNGPLILFQRTFLPTVQVII